MGLKYPEMREKDASIDLTVQGGTAPYTVFRGQQTEEAV